MTNKPLKITFKIRAVVIYFEEIVIYAGKYEQIPMILIVSE